MDQTKTADAVADLLAALDVDEGEHTADTPNRVARYWAEALDGYNTNPTEHLRRTFTTPGDPGLVMVSGIEVTSTCAHHLLPITGTATVAYRPEPGDTTVVGLSKLARVVHGYARRLQVQERIGRQTVEAITTSLRPVGAACVITAEHGCMTVRGVGQRRTVTTTHAWAGCWDAAHADGQAVLAEHRAHASGHS